MKSTYNLHINLKFLLKVHNLSQEEFGKLIANSSGGAVSTWINNTHKPPLEKLIMISDYFKVNVEDLLYSNLSKGGPLTYYELAYLGRRSSTVYDPKYSDEILAKLEQLIQGQDSMATELMKISMSVDEKKKKV